MKAIQKDFWREIRYTRSRFMSILILVALAVAFLSGLRSTAPDMKNTCDSYLDQQNFMDIQVMSTLGLTEEDLESLLDQPGIADGEACWVIDAYAQSPDLDIVAKVYSLPQRLNTITLTDGRMPEAADECVVEEHLLELLSLEIGDTLTLATSGDYADALTVDTVTIVGVVISPLYISVERGTSTLGTGQVAAYLYLPREAFDLDYYTALYLTVEGAAEETAFSTEYDDLVDGVVDALEPLGKERAQLRRESLVDEATEKLDEAQAELDDAKAEAEQELSDAEAELADARKELDDGWAEYLDGVNTFDQEIADAEQEIADGEQELADALAELNDGQKELADARKELDDGWAEYYDGLEEYQENKEKVEDAWDDYYDGLAEYQDGKEQLEDAYRQLINGENSYWSGKEQLDQFVQSYLLTNPRLSSFGSSDALGNALRAEGSAGGPAHNAVNGALSDIQSQISSLKTAVATLDELEAAQPKLESAIAGLDTQISALKEQIAALEAQSGGETPDPAAGGDPAPDGGAAGTDPAALSAVLLRSGGELEALKQRLAAAETQKLQLEEQLAQTEAGLDQIDQTLAAQGLNRTSARQTLATLEAASGQIPASASALRRNYEQLASAKKQLEDGWAEYWDGEEELDDAKRQLDDARAELEDADQELADGKAELDDALA